MRFPRQTLNLKDIFIGDGVNIQITRRSIAMTDKKKNIMFVVFAYVFFWILFLLTGVVFLTIGEGFLFKSMQVICSWAPTMALFVLFRKLYPDGSIKAFYKNAFKKRISISMILFVTIIQLIIFIGAAGILAFSKGFSLGSLLDLSLQTILMGAVNTIISGPTGEESGWRGFLQPSLEKKYSVVRTSLIIGIIWGFWHMPLWFMTSGYSGIELIQYICVFLLAIISAAIIIGICYNRYRNLFIPMWIHFMFNFTVAVFVGEVLDILTYLAILYVFTAIGYIIWHKRSNKISVSTI